MVHVVLVQFEMQLLTTRTGIAYIGNVSPANTTLATNVTCKYRSPP